ncbi:hypothetical protein [Hymenobacter antarcticus]|uniref:Uncharacterized protein n=1 Tax=Hymenobacter antarcticus TaxID=486270 RepID=A0ABP7R0C6_9BACT
MLSFRFGVVLLVGALGWCSGCDKACETDGLPRYPLTPGLRAWSVPDPQGAVFRFRNARTGYVRSYRVVQADNKTDGVSAGLNACPQYYREYTAHVLERTDSIGNRENNALRFDVSTANAPRAKSTFRIGSTTVDLLIQEVEDGTYALSPATFAGRTYPAVLGGTSSLAAPGANVAVTVYLTKADGLVRFEERGGTAWDRL